ncbi:hypothetical protein ACLK1T_13875 [Escherichia coli]
MMMVDFARDVRDIRQLNDHLGRFVCVMRRERLIRPTNPCELDAYEISGLISVARRLLSLFLLQRLMSRLIGQQQGD